MFIMWLAITLATKEAFPFVPLWELEQYQKHFLLKSRYALMFFKAMPLVIAVILQCILYLAASRL